MKYGNWLANQEKNKDLIREAVMQPSINEMKNQIWSLKTLQKIKLFMWKVVSEAIPIADRIMTRGIKVDSYAKYVDWKGSL